MRLNSTDSAHKDVGPVVANLIKALELREQYVFKRRTHQVRPTFVILRKPTHEASYGLVI